MATTCYRDWLCPAACLVLFLIVLYLLRINSLLDDTPIEIRKIAGSPWTKDILKQTYERFKSSPVDYTEQLPPKMDRRYVVTGGNGLVGGFIVLQLLARGQIPESIRILDIKKTERVDMIYGIAASVEFVLTDITSPKSVKAAFNKQWDASVAHLPLTVFHTAAVIIPSDRSKHLYDFPEAVNVHGTRNVLNAAKAAGADIFSSTSSGSIAIQPLNPWVAPWARSIGHFWQVLDEKDFFKPLREHSEFYGNYPASKAIAERLVCEANTRDFQTGCIRPVNGVYGNPTDNTVGDPLARSIFPTWVPHVVQSFVHGANVAVAHLHHESALSTRNAPQAGRPFCVTDPNPPIRYSDLYLALKTLSVHPFFDIKVPPVIVLLSSYCVEWYSVLPHKVTLLQKWLPELKGDIRHLKPGLFSICTHLISTNGDCAKSLSEGGLGYKGVLTTMEGMTLEVLEWNKEHASNEDGQERKAYTTSVVAAETIRNRMSRLASTM